MTTRLGEGFLLLEFTDEKELKRTHGKGFMNIRNTFTDVIEA